ncbi:hypothetical protein WJ966_08425 [Achromobacter xylosoxidans]
MHTDQIPPDYLPLSVPGLPTLYGPNSAWRVWLAALPLPATSRLRGAGALAASKGHARHDRLAQDSEVIAFFENDDGSGEQPAPMMIAAARWLLDHDAAFHRAVVDAMLADLPRLRAEQDGIVLDDDAFRLPPHWDEQILLTLIRLNSITFHPVDGGPYIGLDLRCAWDDEHGYGLMMAGTDVIETGGADVGSLSWIAARRATSLGTGQ